MGKSLSSVFLFKICTDQDPTFHLTHKSTKVKMLPTKKMYTILLVPKQIL